MEELKNLDGKQRKYLNEDSLKRVNRKERKKNQGLKAQEEKCVLLKKKLHIIDLSVGFNKRIHSILSCPPIP